jgi:uncharacterized protein (DUF2235 family)
MDQNNLDSTAQTAAKIAPATASRLVFIFLDGTGNDFSNSVSDSERCPCSPVYSSLTHFFPLSPRCHCIQNYTNLVRMVRLLRKDELATQLIYYGEGLGEHHFGGTAAQGSNISLFEKLTSMAFAE